MTRRRATVDQSTIARAFRATDELMAYIAKRAADPHKSVMPR
jgi:hypothetical protein